MCKYVFRTRQTDSGDEGGCAGTRAYREGERILPYVEASKQGVEFILGSYIIVMLQHIQRQTFAETTRTDKEKITVGAFYQRDLHGTVHIIITIKAYIREIHHAVGQ